MSTLKAVKIDGWSCIALHFDDVMSDDIKVVDNFVLDGRNISIIESVWAKEVHKFLIDSEYDYIVTMNERNLPKNKWTINQKILQYNRNQKIKQLGID